MVNTTEPGVSILYKAGCYLGESPLWHTNRQSYLWVDIENCHLFELKRESGVIHTWQLKERVSFIIEHVNGHVLLGLQGGVVFFNLDNGDVRWLKRINTDKPEFRCNDGYCDPSGRLWIGTMHIEAKPSAGALYCLHPNLNLQKQITGLTIPNGIVWSKEYCRLYFVESISSNVNSYVFDEVNNQLVFEKVIIHVSKDIGKPDGITLDSDGMLWIAIYGGYRVIRCNPADGAVLATILLPVPNVTNCCFAGPALSDLIITTAREHMSKEDIEQYPQSGDVFVVEQTGFTGIPNHKSDIM